MPMRDAVRAVIVVSAEREELALAATLWRSSTVVDEWRVLLPPQLYDLHKHSFAGRAVRYDALGDITGAIAQHDPQLVLLCSAYVFSLNEVLSRRDVHELLDFLRSRRCRIATTDPFFGLAGRLTSTDIDPRYLMPGASRWRRALAAAARAAIGSRVKLVTVPRMDDIVHVYATSPPPIDDGIRRLSFGVPAATPDQPRAAAPPPHPRWLFVLAESDMHAQLVEMELRAFVENLLGMLRFAVAEGARPTLIAPPSIVDLLLAAATPEMELLRHVPLAEFRQRVIDAEYVFTWNAFSLTNVERIATERPVFPFDRGYLARAISSYYDAARQSYYGAQEPRYLDQRQLFSPYVLAHLAKQQRADLGAVRQRWQASPTPDALIRQLLDTAEGSRAG